jgi:hypothetical protein
MVIAGSTFQGKRRVNYSLSNIYCSLLKIWVSELCFKNCISGRKMEKENLFLPVSSTEF